MTLDGFFNIKTALELGIELCKKIWYRETLFIQEESNI